MNGAKEYAEMFKTGQYGKLYLVSGNHARGRTFHIFLLPSSEQVVGIPWGSKDVVEVYGITSGQPGWTETYGWLHRGKWEEDFAKLVETRRKEISEESSRREREQSRLEDERRRRESDLLAKY